MKKNKKLEFNFSVSKALEEGEDLFIEGYASTAGVDKSGDIILTSAWETGMTDYLKNPVILGFHNHSNPVGRMVEHKIDTKGLWIKAKISKAATNIFNLVKDGIITAFSVGIMVKDATYDAVTDLFIIKEVDLFEVSVVSVPANQDALFNVSKAFDSAEDCKSYKMLFSTKSAQGNELVSSIENNKLNTLEELQMTPEELQALVTKAAAEAVAADRAKQAAVDKAAEEKAAANAALDEKIKSAITVGESGAQKLLSELEARVKAAEEGNKKSMDDLAAALKEKSDEVLALQKSKMVFGDSSKSDYQEKENAVFLAKMLNKDITDTKYGRTLVEKAGAHVPNSTWELEVSLKMENEVRQKLVVANALRSINMQTNVMKLALNPEAGYGTWVTNAQFGTSASAGAAQTHQLKEVTLSAYKLATSEYMAFEEDEDSLLVLVPVIRDAMVRRTAKSVDKAMLLGAGTGSDPVKGLAMYDATSVVTVPVANKVTAKILTGLRRDLGQWGLDPSNVTYIVSGDVYYDILEDSDFQSRDKVADAATFITGQVGAIGSSRVLVSGEFPAKVAGAANATTNFGAVAVATSNFLVGNQRGLRFDTQDLVETQRKVMVASLRTGMTQLTSAQGDGVSALRYVP